MKKNLIIICLISMFLLSNITLPSHAESNDKPKSIGFIRKTNDNIFFINTDPTLVEDQYQHYEPANITYCEALHPLLDYCQSFIPTLNILSKFRIDFSYDGNPNGYITRIDISLRDSRDGEDLILKSIDPSIITSTDKTIIEVDCHDMQIYPGTTYYIIIHPVGDIDDYVVDFNKYFINANMGFTQKDGYQNGKAYVIYEGEWSEMKFQGFSNPIDLIFINYGPDNPPETPMIFGPEKGKQSKDIPFTFRASDPDGHDIYLYVYWDDPHDPEDWHKYGPYKSGSDITLSHKWVYLDEYTVEVYAQDRYGLGSSHSYHDISIQKGLVNKPLVRNYLIDRLLHYLKEKLSSV